MNILNDEEIHLKFLLNSPVYVEGIGNFQVPLLSEIANMTEAYYNSSLSAIFLDKKQLDNQEEVEKYTDFEIISSAALYDSSFRELFFSALNLHFKCKPIMHDRGIIYFTESFDGDIFIDSILTEEKFHYIKKLVSIANSIGKAPEEEYNAGNEIARKLIEKIKKKKAEAMKYEKKKINLHSIISAVGWKAESFDSISKLSIYQLYNGYGRLGIIDNYHYTMTGIYAGTVDAKGIKLPDLNWANIIQQK